MSGFSRSESKNLTNSPQSVFATTLEFHKAQVESLYIHMLPLPLSPSSSISLSSLASSATKRCKHSRDMVYVFRDDSFPMRPLFSSRNKIGIAYDSPE
ncbi:hypothetical protein TNCV_1002311 [Trichonephila clavipes]|nr:hypothetical protein TNCV_1002311 [Trichonephila clavipes]